MSGRQAGKHGRARIVRFDDRVADSEVWQLPGLWFNADELRALLTREWTAWVEADPNPGSPADGLRSLGTPRPHSCHALTGDLPVRA